MYYVYVLFNNQDKKFYIGYTKNLKRRLREHRCNKVYTTQRFSEVHLIFYEGFVSKEDALRREGYLKTTKGKKGLRLILRDSLKVYNDCPVV